MSPIDEELNWRDLEIAHAKMEYARHPASSIQKLLAAKVLILVGYAHYEGFTKFLWDTYLNHLQTQDLKIFELSKSIKIHAIQPLFNKVKAAWGAADFIDELDSGNTLQARIQDLPPLKTNSNLWPNLLRDNNLKIDITLSTLTSNSAKVKKLVGLRNSIAHGNRLELTNSDEVLELLEAVSTVMVDLAIEIDEAIRLQKYLAPPPE